MRKLFTVLAAAGVALLGVSAANAGSLSGATLNTVAQGNPINVPGVGATGTSSATSATLDAGSAFATTKTIVIGTTVSSVTVKIGHNGKLTATSGGAINVTAPITGNVGVYGLGGINLLNIPLAIGQAGTTYGTALGGHVQLTIIGNAWTLGSQSQGGLTSGGNPLPNVTSTGSFNLNATGNGTVKLVSVGKVIVAGLQTSTTASPTTLTLHYTPEPGTLLLLGAGILGLGALGRKKRA